MKFVAKKDFANAPALGLKLTEKTPGFVHELHVHKGHRFEVGSTDIFDDLKPNEKDVVAQLIAGKSAVYDSTANKSVIAKIDAEVEADAAAEDKRKEKAAAAESITVAGVLAALPEMIAQAVAAANKV